MAHCPKHMLCYEVMKTRTVEDGLVVYTKAPQCEHMSWGKLAEAIESMPEWARDMPAAVYVEDKTKVYNDTNHGIGEIITYFGKRPSQVQDDGNDFVFMVLDTETM